MTKPRFTLFYDRILPEILDWVNAYNYWRASEKPDCPFERISDTLLPPRRGKGGGRAYSVNRLQFFCPPGTRDCFYVGLHHRAVATVIFDSFDKRLPILFLLVDHLEGLGVRFLTHRIHILESSRQSVDQQYGISFLHIADYDLLGQDVLRRVVRRDEFVQPFIDDLLPVIAAQSSFSGFDWIMQIEISRHIVLRTRYTYISQQEAKIRYSSKIDLLMQEFQSGGHTLLSPLMTAIAALRQSRQHATEIDRQKLEIVMWADRIAGIIIVITIISGIGAAAYLLLILWYE